MADFPSINPVSRTYTPGSVPVLSTFVLTGDQLSVRKNNGFFGDLLSLSFVSSTLTDQQAIFIHYATENQFNPFDLPAIVLTGSGITVPTGYKWIYAEPPQATYTADVVTVAVTLQLVQPYDL